MCGLQFEWKSRHERWRVWCFKNRYSVPDTPSSQKYCHCFSIVQKRCDVISGNWVCHKGGEPYWCRSSNLMNTTSPRDKAMSMRFRYLIFLITMTASDRLHIIAMSTLPCSTQRTGCWKNSSRLVNDAWLKLQSGTLRRDSRSLVSFL